MKKEKYDREKHNGFGEPVWDFEDIESDKVERRLENEN